jgi:hypothetical protein
LQHEIAENFVQPQNHPILSKVKRYGSDGSSLNKTLIENTESAGFVLKFFDFHLLTMISTAGKMQETIPPIAFFYI